ncbi:heavy metal translocating P-type ATPase [Candidatus Uabimicrobium sp. HlEnr_7]|uniref:heavy metal translocating P-type ATPase n=1 Tax=Candidatus Uabimicrobium helgolandensis TaxID=3095367 RepID=UPI003558D9FD
MLLNLNVLGFRLRRCKILTPCFHCGLPCLDDTIKADEHHFCCHGCLFVFNILQGSSLHKYYELTKSPGKPIVNKSQEDYAYLNNVKFINHFLKFSEKNTAIAQFHIPNIHCASCIWLLENIYQLHNAIKNVDVHFSSREVHIKYDSQQMMLSEIVFLLGQLGYPPRLSLDNKKLPIKDREDILRLGVAGFCFGNVMLFSFSEYLANKEQIPNEFLRFFGYLNIALTLPVFFYSAKEWLYSSWISCKKRTMNLDVPIALGLLALFLTSLFDIFTYRGSGYCDSLCGFVFFLLIGKFFQKRTFQNLSFDRDYKSYFPLSTVRIKHERKNVVSVHELQVNDQIYIRHQELIPTDGKLLSSIAQIDYSFVSGESDLITKTEGEFVFAGGRIVGKAVVVKVKKEVEKSFLTSLWRNVQNKEKSQVRSITNKISPFFTMIVIAIAIATFMYYWLILRNVSLAWYTFSSVLIVACPCALALTSAFTHGAMLRLLESHRIFCKNGEVLEKLARIKHVVFDKTGTLTSLKPNIQLLFGTINDKQQQILASIVSQSIHPVSRALSKKFPVLTPINLTQFREISGKGIHATYNKQDFYVGSIKWISSFTKVSDDILLNLHLQNAVGFTIGNKLCSIFSINSSFRCGWENIVSSVAHKHSVHLISGDSNRDFNTVKRVFPEKNIRFNLNPFDKVTCIERLQTNAERGVMMVGDGLNDSGALIKSDVGIAIIEKNSHFSPASDIILAAEKISLLPKLFYVSRATLYITYTSFVISCIYNSLGIALAVSGKLTPVFVAILMPVSSITVMLFTTLSARYFCKNILGGDKWE